ncbi:P-loop NTPase family protein [Georgenia ruanii]|uniref:ATP-binding cassette domain-containing protein n=1 Tax=Georgenia ruanii TaxID=348442 RepID=A0A7J9UWV2_9MICO|nr:ATP-binding cassette domain-containing protein [Georgenia ruanii]MPV89098.1 ATP-binding cassette domain-containing protein [Georgenia ruanii]
MTTLTAPTRTAVAAEARAVVKTYGRGATEVRALDGADLRLPAGRFTVVMGRSDSGRSTLMHVLVGLDAVDAGQVPFPARRAVRLDLLQAVAAA